MSTWVTTLGLSPDGTGSTPAYAPYYVMANFFLAYVVLSSRPLKNALHIDHNVCPREDITKYGEAAVQKGKISRAQLNMLKRNEAAHANAVEHFPMLVGSLLFALQAGVPNHTINRSALVYTGARIAYAAAYLLIEDVKLSYLRSLLWWAGNVTCLRLLWLSAGQ